MLMMLMLMLMAAMAAHGTHPGGGGRIHGAAGGAAAGRAATPSIHVWRGGYQSLRAMSGSRPRPTTPASLWPRGLRASHLPTHTDKISRHNAHHLMRVFPKGTRISSKNLHPVPFWGIGAQICALNWQTFGASMQLNEALFAGSEGFILKPAELRPGGSDTLHTCR